MEEEAEDWLNDLGLREFVPKFKSIGIMEIDDFCSVDGSHLDEMGLTRYQVLNVVYKSFFYSLFVCLCYWRNQQVLFFSKVEAADDDSDDDTDDDVKQDTTEVRT